MSQRNLQFTALRFREFPTAFEPARALLVLVHGRTGNLRVLEFFAKRDALKSMAKLVIEAPFPDSRSDQKEEGFSWYIRNAEGEGSAIDKLKPTFREQLDDSRRRLSLLVDSLEAAGWNPSQIFWLGFSQGAAMILDLALRESRHFGGFVCVSGLCLSGVLEKSQVSPSAWDQKIVITHGSRDDIISLEDADHSYAFLRTLKIPYTWKVFDKPHSFKLKEELPWIESQLETWIRQMP